MNTRGKNDLKELRVFLIALGIALAALVLMAFILGYLGTKVPIPPLDNQ